jgi:transcriptional regulator with XRE-family HTH domain
MPSAKAAKKAAQEDGFAGRLRDLRKQKGLSQTELAEAVGVHYTHIGRYERGKSRPAADTLKRLADALGVSGDYLLEGATEAAARARFEDRELLRQFQEVEKLPDADKAVIKRLLDAFLTKKQIQELAAR